MGKYILGPITAVQQVYTKGYSHTRDNDIKNIPVTVTNPNFYDYNLKQFRSYGYGLITNIEKDDPNNSITSITISDSFFYRKGERCSFLEGYFSGYFSLLLSTNVAEPENPHTFEDQGAPNTGKMGNTGERVFIKV